MKLINLLKSLFYDFINFVKPEIENIKNGSSIEYSTGEYLENIRVLENAQKGTNEEEQRSFIYLKIAEKHSDGTLPDLKNILNIATTGEINEYRKRIDVLIDSGCDYPSIIADTIRKAKASGVQVNAYINQDLFRLDISKLDNDKLGRKL